MGTNTTRNVQIYVPEEIRRLLKAVAASRGITMSLLVQEALLAWCERQPEVKAWRKRQAAA
jgi:hypothetical protein